MAKKRKKRREPTENNVRDDIIDELIHWDPTPERLDERLWSQILERVHKRYQAGDRRAVSFWVFSISNDEAESQALLAEVLSHEPLRARAASDQRVAAAIPDELPAPGFSVSDDRREPTRSNVRNDVIEALLHADPIPNSLGKAVHWAGILERVRQRYQADGHGIVSLRILELVFVADHGHDDLIGGDQVLVYLKSVPPSATLAS